MTDYFFIEAHGPDESAVRNGFRWLIDVKTGEEAILAIPLLTNLQGVIENVLGRDNVKKLKKNKHIILNGTKINLSTIKSMTYTNSSVKILVVYLRPKDLDAIESNYYNISAILSIPWIEKDISEWKTTRRAVKYE